MRKYIALLRGINVGGKNKVSMKELKEGWENNGFEDVESYINSGNILFSSEHSELDFLKNRCEALILEQFKIHISVMVISVGDFMEALNAAPGWWDTDKESKHNGIFVIAPMTVEEVIEAAGESKPEYEKVAHYGQLIFWSAKLETFSKTRWSKVVAFAHYDSITIRNANTLKKLMHLCQLK